VRTGALYHKTTARDCQPVTIDLRLNRVGLCVFVIFSRGMHFCHGLTKNLLTNAGETVK
jgi:hypothetical protein